MTNTPRSSVGRFLSGAASALLIVSVLLKHVPAAELIDWLRVVGFALLVGGGLLARRAPLQTPVA